MAVVGQHRTRSGLPAVVTTATEAVARQSEAAIPRVGQACPQLARLEISVAELAEATAAAPRFSAQAATASPRKSVQAFG